MRLSGADISNMLFDGQDTAKASGSKTWVHIFSNRNAEELKVTLAPRPRLPDTLMSLLSHGPSVASCNASQTNVSMLPILTVHRKFDTV